VLEHLQRGVWTPGQKLPTEVELAQQFETTRSNVNQAMKALEEAGVVRRYRRRGTFAQAVPTFKLGKALELVKPRTRKVHVIAPLDSLISHMHWSAAALSELESTLNGHNMQLVHRSLPDNPSVQEFAQRIGEVAEEESRGLILLVNMGIGNHAHDSDEALLPYVQSLLDYPGQICWFNRSGASLAYWPYDAVSLSPLDEGIAVGHYLVQQQVRQVICVQGSRFWSRARMAGVRLVAEQEPRSIRLRDFALEPEETTHPTLLHQVLDAVQQCQEPPTVVMLNDHFAAQLLDLARERGLSCPRHFNLIGFDNDDRYRSYNITTVAPPAARVGEVIGHLLSDQVTRPAQAGVTLKLKSVIVERSTFSSADRRSF
jgi:DNA-binding LacI/PurR family transcriptional regulator